MMTQDEALHLFRSADLVSIGFEADALRKRLHPEPVISYALSRKERPNEETGHLAILELTTQASLVDRVTQIAELRKKQEQTRQFLCFAVLIAGEGNVTAAEYVKMLAISRLYLDNIAHAQAPVSALDTKLAQVSMRFGANDLGVVDLESSGEKTAISEEQVRRLIRDAGLVPKQRDSLFRSYFLY